MFNYLSENYQINQYHEDNYTSGGIYIDSPDDPNVSGGDEFYLFPKLPLIKSNIENNDSKAFQI